MSSGSFKKYGDSFPSDTTPATVELYEFYIQGELGRFEHLRNAINHLWNATHKNAFIFNDWSELMLRAFCDNTWTTVTGAAASWKTTCAAIYALCRWFASPCDTVVIGTSTTLDGLRRRLWKEVSKYYRLCPALGNPIQSRNCIQYRKGHDDAGIFGLATDKGELDRAIGKIIGFHAKHIIVIVDEMPYTPEAIVEACVNLQTGAEFFQFIGLGNADDHLDPHGRMCEPSSGWDSITPEQESWQTKRGVCIHLDALNSPNVKEGGNRYPGLVRQSDIDTTADIYGIDSPQFWQMRRGFWPPEGIQKTVLSSAIIQKFEAAKDPIWNDSFTLGAALDPAFEGGDRCCLRIGKCGYIQSKLVLALSETIFIKTQVSPDDPIHYQIARQVKEECVARGIPPRMLALDSTGEGGGLASVIQREWSPEILLVEFGGRASSRPVSSTNPKRCDQEYLNRVTELWFQFRILVQNGQVRGLDVETASEFCRRWWEMRGPFIMVEPKAKMKERTRKSPDLADAAVVLSELFRDRMNILRHHAISFPADSRWRKFVLDRQLESDYAGSTG